MANVLMSSPTQDCEDPLLYTDRANSHVFLPKIAKSPTGRRRLLFAVAACTSLAVVSFCGLFIFTFWTRHPVVHSPISQDSSSYVSVNDSSPIDESKIDPFVEPEPFEEIDPWDPSHYLNGPPTGKFRGWYILKTRDGEKIEMIIYIDNIRDEYKYLTSWISAGWSELFV
jgi:hypothetical protein